MSVIVIPEHTLHETVYKDKKDVGPQVSSQKQRALIVLLINCLSTAVGKLENSPPKDQKANKSQSGSLNCGRIHSSGSVRSCTVGSRRGKRVASRQARRVRHVDFPHD